LVRLRWIRVAITLSSYRRAGRETDTIAYIFLGNHKRRSDSSSAGTLPASPGVGGGQG
jgi:hypothetical protein